MVIKAQATDGNNTPINPGAGVVPIMKEIAKGKLSIIGTGFYITRYGLFLTAEHVLSELHNVKSNDVHKGFICHLAEPDKIHLRRIKSISLFQGADIAVGQADNYVEKFPKNPLMNVRINLGRSTPKRGDYLVTYAYPENKTLDFTAPKNQPTVKGDYYQGKCLKCVTEYNVSPIVSNEQQI